jgi:hypothetical protein
MLATCSMEAYVEHMNFLAHHEVARRLSSDADYGFRFGAMVPDFVGMLRLQRTYKTSTIVGPRVASGIRLHYATNEAFDELEVIKSLEESLYRSFKDVLPGWSARQGAVAGKDMLFDGFCCRNETMNQSYRRTMAAAASGQIILENVAEPEDVFVEGIRGLQAMDVPRYDDPTVFATRLQRRLQGLRSEFDDQLIPAVASAAAVHQPDLMSRAGGILDTVVAELVAAY